jgi:hypothetical protein
MRRRVTIVLFLVVLVAGCGGDPPAGARSEPFALVEQPVERIAASQPDALMDAILAQLGESELGSLQPAKRGTVLSGRDPQTRVQARAHFSALVAGSVYRDQAPLHGLRTPHEYRATDSGGTSYADAIAGEAASVSSYLSASEGAYRRLIERNVARIGLSLVSLDFLHPEGITVPIAVVRAPTEFLQRSGGVYLGYAIFRDAADDDRSLGWYVDVVGEDDRWVQSQGLVTTAGSGSYAVGPYWASHVECGGPIPCPMHG